MFKQKKYFLAALICIVIGGFLLRMIDYDKLPAFGETMDEFLYPWQGMTMLQGKSPVGWSWLQALNKGRTFVDRWGHHHPLTSPWMEKPPLYSWIVGSVVLLHGDRDIFDVRLTTIRLVPIMLSLLTIILLAYLGQKIYSSGVGLTAGLLYATTPFIIMSNRLSLVENALTPLILTIILLLLYQEKIPRRIFPLLIGALGGMAILFKQVGLAVPIAIAVYFITTKQWKNLFLSTLLSILIGLIFPALGYFYGWESFVAQQKELQVQHHGGLPQVINNIFLYPILGDVQAKRLWLEGVVLLGSILFFAAPFSQTKRTKYESLLTTFPLIYIMLLALVETGSGLYYYGWYLYPILPFLVLMVAKAFYELWNNFHINALFVLTIILGSTSIRFVLLLLGDTWQTYWQLGLLGLFFLGWLGMVFESKKVQKPLMVGLFILFIMVQIIISSQLIKLYPNLPQPLL